MIETTIIVAILLLGYLSWHFSRSLRGEHLDSKARRLGYFNSSAFLEHWSSFLSDLGWDRESPNGLRVWRLRGPYKNFKVGQIANKTGDWILVLRPDPGSFVFNLDLIVVSDSEFHLWEKVSNLTLEQMPNRFSDSQRSEGRAEEMRLYHFARAYNQIRFGSLEGPMGCAHRWRQIESRALLECRLCGTLRQINQWTMLQRTWESAEE